MAENSVGSGQEASELYSGKKRLGRRDLSTQPDRCRLRTSVWLSCRQNFRVMLFFPGLASDCFCFGHLYADHYIMALTVRAVTIHTNMESTQR